MAIKRYVPPSLGKLANVLVRSLSGISKNTYDPFIRIIQDSKGKTVKLEFSDQDEDIVFISKLNFDSNDKLDDIDTMINLSNIQKCFPEKSNRIQLTEKRDQLVINLGGKSNNYIPVSGPRDHNVVDLSKYESNKGKFVLDKSAAFHALNKINSSVSKKSIPMLVSNGDGIVYLISMRTIGLAADFITFSNVGIAEENESFVTIPFLSSLLKEFIGLFITDDADLTISYSDEVTSIVYQDSLNNSYFIAIRNVDPDKINNTTNTKLNDNLDIAMKVKSASDELSNVVLHLEVNNQGNCFRQAVSDMSIANSKVETALGSSFNLDIDRKVIWTKNYHKIQVEREVELTVKSNRSEYARITLLQDMAIAIVDSDKFDLKIYQSPTTGKNWGVISTDILNAYLYTELTS